MLGGEIGWGGAYMGGSKRGQEVGNNLNSGHTGFHVVWVNVLVQLMSMFCLCRVFPSAQRMHIVWDEADSVDSVPS